MLPPFWSECLEKMPGSANQSQETNVRSTGREPRKCRVPALVRVLVIKGRFLPRARTSGTLDRRD